MQEIVFLITTIDAFPLQRVQPGYGHYRTVPPGTQHYDWEDVGRPRPAALDWAQACCYGHRMDESVPVLDPPRNRWLDKLQAVLEILLVSGLVSSFFAAIPFSFRRGQDALLHDARAITGFILLEACITLFFLFMLLRAHGETLADYGVRRPNLLPNVAVGLAVMPLLFLTNAVVTEFFRRFLPGYYMERNPLVDLIRTPVDFVLFLFSGLLAGGIKEELQRAFILCRFRQHLGGAWLGLVLWSLAFAAGHYLQGAQGVVVAGILGLIFGILYLTRNSVITPIVSHATYDSIVLVGYWFFLRSGP